MEWKIKVRFDEYLQYLFASQELAERDSSLPEHHTGKAILNSGLCVHDPLSSLTMQERVANILGVNKLLSSSSSMQTWKIASRDSLVWSNRLRRRIWMRRRLREWGYAIWSDLQRRNDQQAEEINYRSGKQEILLEDSTIKNNEWVILVLSHAPYYKFQEMIIWKSKLLFACAISSRF